MTFANSTTYAAIDVPMQDPAGRDVVIALIKATFRVGTDGCLTLADKPAPIRVNDELNDPDEAESSLLFPSDVCIAKDGTDVLVVGEAISPAPVTAVDVAVKVRDVTVPLRVHGERFFYDGVGSVLISPAAAFERKPITYERAYGGYTEDYEAIEPRNPSGVGVAVRKWDLVGRPAPQIEHPARPHKSASDTHPPVGYGAIRSHWSPRREFAGTFDDAWKQTRFPLLPADFNIRFNNVAHPSLVFSQPLVPGDTVVILGMTADGLLRFELPDPSVIVRARFDRSGKVAVRPAIDTVLVRPGERLVEIVLRQAFPVGRAQDVLREIRIEPS